MFSGPPLPLLPDFRLRQLIPIINCRQQVGAWVRDTGFPHRLLINAGGRCVPVLIGGDLGALLPWCSEVVIREDSQPIMVETAALIRWRALQVVTGTPYLPCAERLKEIFPDADLEPAGFMVPTQNRSPEEILVDCMTHEIQVAGSRIVYGRMTNPHPEPGERSSPAPG